MILTQLIKVKLSNLNYRDYHDNELHYRDITFSIIAQPYFLMVACSYIYVIRKRHVYQLLLTVCVSLYLWLM